MGDRLASCARAALLSLGALALAGCERLVDAAIERNLTRVERAGWDAERLHVVLCGTGSPIADPERAASCTAVVAGGALYLVDVGPGAWERVDLESLPAGRLRAVFLTHFHSDHIGDLGEAMTQSWIAGRAAPLEVHGPPGVDAVAAGFVDAYAADARGRVAHHGDAYMPAAAAPAVARPFAMPEPAAPVVVLERDGLRVTAFAVDHEPVRPAVGYRFDWRGRSVVVSGDTRASDSLVLAARGADLLVHEVLDADATGRAAAVAERLGNTRLAKLARDIPSYHTSPQEAGRVARQADVETLVLTHLVPPPGNALLRRRFVRGAQAEFSGAVVVGEDGMRFDLAPR